MFRVVLDAGLWGLATGFVDVEAATVDVLFLEQAQALPGLGVDKAGSTVVVEPLHCAARADFSLRVTLSSRLSAGTRNR